VADDAGALLVRSGLVTPSALDDARLRVEDLGGTLGEHLVFAASISDDALTDFYRSRLLVPQVNPNTLARLPVRVIAAIPSDMAIELRAIPVALDAENNLTVAMSDPSDRHAVDEIAFFTGSYVVRAVATQMQIAWCLAHYYGHVTALGQRLLQGSSSEPATKPAPAAVATPAPAPRTKGLTSKVQAMRHRGIVPATGPVNVQRPMSGQIAIATPIAAPPVIPPMAVEPVRPVSQPGPASDGVPETPRARSVSGEIRIPVRRAESIKPVMEDPLEDESGPVITVEVSLPDDEETGPRKPAPRRRKVKSDPPELYARAGEVNIANDRDRSVDSGPGIIIADDLLEPPPQEDRTGEFEAAPRRGGDGSNGTPMQTIEVSDEASAGVVIHASYDQESEPVLLERRRPSDPPPAVAPPSPDGNDDDDDDVVVLDAKKPFTRATRPARPTQVGIGALPAVTRAHRDTEAELDAPTSVDTMAVAPDPDDPSSDEIAAPPAPVRDDTSLHNLAEPPRPAPPRLVTAPIVRKHAPTLDELDDYDYDRSVATSVMSASELDDAIPQRSSEVVPAHLATKRHAGVPASGPIDHDSLDDGWGPPGTTIPPPLLGAVPGSADDDVPGRIPVSSVDTAPLIVAPPSPPEPARGMPAVAIETSSSHAQKDATSRLLDLIRALEYATDRDGVVNMMVAHLAETHRRAGFFVVKAGAAKGITELSVFTIEPRPLTIPFATLRLDRPSTLQDVVGTRLPYRGPTHDEASRIFLSGVLGVAPIEILLVPVTVRERVVGVLFAEHRLRHTFDDQLALAARAAGEALERILVAKRS